MNQKYFLAVCKDRPNDFQGFYFTVYFVNNTDEEITNLSYETGGFATFDDELVQTEIHKKNLGRVEPNSAVIVETDDEGAFDFVINFSFHLELGDGKKEEQDFTIGKYLSGGKKPLDSLPVLDQFGYAFFAR